LKSIIWGTYQNVRVGQISGAEGAKLRLPSSAVATTEATEVNASVKFVASVNIYLASGER